MKAMRLFILSTIALFSAAGCQKADEAPPPEPKPDETLAAPPKDPDIIVLSSEAAANAGLGVQPVGPATIHHNLSLQGELKPVSEKLAAIVARLEGVVTKVAKKEGDRVKTGEAMVTIESKKLAQSKLAYLEAEHRLHFAREALKREAELMEKKISSKEAYQKVAHEREEAELAHASALQNLKLLGFSEPWLHKLEKNPNQKMTNYTLRAPFDGEVIQKDVTLGEAVMEEKTLFRLADLSELLVEVKVPMGSVPIFPKGTKVTVICDVLSLTAEGTVDFVASIAEPETRTVPVRVRIANPEGKWRPGMPARIELKEADVTTPIAVPAAAVHEIAGKPSVFVQVDANTYKRVSVSLGPADDTYQAVADGLTAGDKVVVENSLTLKSAYLMREGE